MIKVLAHELLPCTLLSNAKSFKSLFTNAIDSFVGQKYHRRKKTSKET
jgi:hypothetical protein